MKYILNGLLVFFFLINLNAQTVAWRGENFSGKFNVQNLLTEWPDEGPVKVLQVDDIGIGWGSAILADNKIYVIGKKDTSDILSCYDPEGQKLWDQSVGASWNGSFPEARTTPTVDGDRIYAISGRGNLSCFNAETGNQIWSVNVDSLYEAKWHIWGVAESPLIVNDMVISVPAGELTTMVALNKMTGELIWKSEPLGHLRSYVSPVLFETDSIQQIVGITTQSVFGADVKTGKIEWEYNISERMAEIKNDKVEDNINANSPLIKGNRIYVSQGYDNLSVMLEVSNDGKQVKECWVDRTLDCHHGGVVELDGYIYGSNWYSNRDGVWVCLDWESGEVFYVDRWNSKGVIVAAEGLLYIYDEKPGEMAISKADKKGLEIISSFKVDFGKGQHWAHPFIAEGKLLLRHGESFGVFNISK